MNTIPKNQTTLPPQLFVELQTKAKMFGVSIKEYIQHSTLAEKKLNKEKQKLKTWQKEFDAKLAKLPTRRATLAEERAIARGRKEIKEGKCKIMTVKEIMQEATV